MKKENQKQIKILLILSFIFTKIDSYHIVFEQIGEIASSVTYIHTKLTIDLDSIEEQLRIFATRLKRYDNYFIPGNFELGGVSKYINESSAVHLRNHIVQRNLEAAKRIVEQKKGIIVELTEDLEKIRQSMPIPQDKDRMLVQRTVREEGKEKVVLQVNPSLKMNPVLNDMAKGRTTRFLNPIGFALGAFGTFMGLYNRRQIENLRNEISKKHGALIEVIESHEKQIADMNITLHVLQSFISSSLFYDLTVFSAELSNIETHLRNRITYATHAIQAAQNRRLAIDFMKPEKLKALYEKLVKQARTMGQQLLTNQPSDLFQLETSYFFDGNNIHLLLHVPTIPTTSKMRLLKLHPFPLPLNENFTITPDVDNDILAVSPGFDRQSSHLTAIDLLGCHAVNKVYLCERNGVLSKELNNSCLGALYLQDYTIAKELCDFKIMPVQEVVRQLLDNWFIVYSPIPQTAFISCHNGTQLETYIKTGVNKIHLSPGCTTNLLEHRLHADGSVQLPTDFTDFEWNWNIAHELQMQPDNIDELIKELQFAGIENPSLKDLSHLKIKKSSKLRFLWYFLSFIFSCVALGLVIILILALVTKSIIVDWKKIKSYLFKQPELIEPIIQAVNAPLLGAPANCPTTLYPMH